MLMTWCFSTRASVATVLTMHPCVSQCLGVKSDLILSLRCHSISNHWQLNSLFNNLFWLTTKKTSSYFIGQCLHWWSSSQNRSLSISVGAGLCHGCDISVEANVGWFAHLVGWSIFSKIVCDSMIWVLYLCTKCCPCFVVALRCCAQYEGYWIMDPTIWYTGSPSVEVSIMTVLSTQWDTPCR